VVVFPQCFSQVDFSPHIFKVANYLQRGTVQSPNPLSPLHADVHIVALQSPRPG
jgi:hypothetical protein